MTDKVLNNTTLLIRLCLGLAVTEEELSKIDKDSVKQAYKLARSHDLSHLVASAVKK